MNIDNPYFEGMVNQIYLPELQLNKANISDTEAPFLDLHLSVANGFGSSVRLYDGPDLKLFILVGWDRSFLSVAWPTGVQLVFFFCSRVSGLVSYSAPRDLHRRAAYSICESLFLIHQDVYHDLFVCS